MKRLVYSLGQTLKGHPVKAIFFPIQRYKILVNKRNAWRMLSFDNVLNLSPWKPEYSSSDPFGYMHVKYHQGFFFFFLKWKMWEIRMLINSLNFLSHMVYTIVDIFNLHSRILKLVWDHCNIWKLLL